jgi:hypothetical protein
MFSIENIQKLKYSCNPTMMQGFLDKQKAKTLPFQ